jgi:uncharacterized SAM-dependent methyltransferase
MASLAQSIVNVEQSKPEAGSFAADVLEGLRATPKRIPAKCFYDDEGSRLFDRITEQPEYYPTRTEIGILQDNAAAISELVKPGAAIVEFGSGCAGKIDILLKAMMPSLAAYVPVEICASIVEDEAARLNQDFPALDVHPVTADFSRPFKLPEAARNATARVGFFPGSTIGNFEPHHAAGFDHDRRRRPHQAGGDSQRRL